MSIMVLNQDRFLGRVLAQFLIQESVHAMLFRPSLARSWQFETVSVFHEFEIAVHDSIEVTTPALYFVFGLAQYVLVVFDDGERQGVYAAHVFHSPPDEQLPVSGPNAKAKAVLEKALPPKVASTHTTLQDRMVQMLLPPAATPAPTNVCSSSSVSTDTVV